MTPPMTPEDREATEREIGRLRAVVSAFLHWAEQKCPCHNDEPATCPLCGASEENLEACKAADNTLPRRLLEDARATLTRTEPAHGR